MIAKSHKRLLQGHKVDCWGKRAELLSSAVASNQMQTLESHTWLDNASHNSFPQPMFSQIYHNGKRPSSFWAKFSRNSWRDMKEHESDYLSTWSAAIPPTLEELSHGEGKVTAQCCANANSQHAALDCKQRPLWCESKVNANWCFWLQYFVAKLNGPLRIPGCHMSWTVPTQVGSTSNAWVWCFAVKFKVSHADNS